MQPFHPTIGKFRLDSQMGVLAWDAGMRALTGLPTERAIGRKIEELFSQAEAETIRQCAVEVLRSGRPFWREFPSGSSKPEETSPAPPPEKVWLLHAEPPIRENAKAEIPMALWDMSRQWAAEKRLTEGFERASHPERLNRAAALAQLQGPLSSAGWQTLVTALGDPDWQVRRQAVEGILRRLTEDAVPRLIRAVKERRQEVAVLNSLLSVLILTNLDIVETLVPLLSDPDPDVRIYTALTLGLHGDRRAAPALVRALDDPDPNVQYHAIEGLGRLRAPEAIERLVEIACSGDFFLGFPALDALRKIGDPSAAPRLLPLLRDELLRRPAIDALGELGDERVAEPLIEQLEEEDAPAEAVATALVRLAFRLEPARAFTEPRMEEKVRTRLTERGRRRLIEALGRAKEEQLSALIRMLGWTRQPDALRALLGMLHRPQARDLVVEILSQEGKPVLSDILAALDSEEPEIVEAIVRILGELGAPEAVRPLVDLLEREPELAPEIAGALGKISDPAAEEPLLKLAGSEEPAARRAAVIALSGLQAADLPERLLKELFPSANPRARQSAAELAALLELEACREAILRQGRDADVPARCAAIEALPMVRISSEQALPLLKEAAEDRDPNVRKSAVRALARFQSPEVEPILIAALRDEHPWVRHFAARSLGIQGRPQAFEALLRAAETDPAPFVRAEAMEALGALDGAEAVQALSRWIDMENPDLACAAIRGLGRSSHPKALPALAQALRSSGRERRLEALRALGEQENSAAAELIFQALIREADPALIRAGVESLIRQGSVEAVCKLARLSVRAPGGESCLEELTQAAAARREAILELLQDPDPAIRKLALELISVLKPPETREWIGLALQDAHPQVRLAAIRAAARTGADLQAELERLAREDTDPAVRRAAREAVADSAPSRKNAG